MRDGDGSQLGLLFDRNNDPEITRFFHPFPMTAKSAQTLVENMGKDRFYVATQNSDFVAFAMLRGWNEGFHTPRFGIMVDRNYTGFGVGRSLAEYVIEDARQAGVSEIHLRVSPDNERAISLYISLGLKIIHL